MKSKWGRMDWVILLIGLIPVVAGWSLYDRLPEIMATHWSLFNNQPNGHMSKTVSLSVLSALLLGVPILMKGSRRIDPRRDNYEKFAQTYDILRLTVTLVLGIAMGFTLLYNLGYEFNNSRVALIMVGGLFAVMGNYMGRIRYNYFVGIRTPWTLANEEVWRRTHRFAGPFWFFGGVVTLICAFLPNALASTIAIVVIAVVVLVPIVYSYLAFARETKGR